MSNLPSYMVGWDIGGAHLKAVLLNTKGEVVDCLQLPCPLWKGLDYLQRAMSDALLQLNLSGTRQPQGLSPQNISVKADYSCVKALSIAPCDVNRTSACHAITMTGELVDLFENRHQGVCEIAKLATNILGEETLFYAANTGFVPLKCVSELSANIASTNWHASVSALAMHVTNALFVDIGSTTTDIIGIEGGKVVSERLSDAHRLVADSLVYTGVVRTPVMALAQKLVFEGVETNVAAEYFATMADVYRLTCELTADDADTADGKGKTQLESARRLARMIGHDIHKSDTDESLEKWIKLAFACRRLQMQQIKAAMQKQLKPNMPIIGAGAGSFLVKAIADDLGCRFMHAYECAWEPISMRPSPTNNQLQLVYSAGMTLAVTGHIDLSMQHNIEVCFSAYAVAFLAQKNQLC